mgnify:FL=1
MVSRSNLQFDPEVFKNWLQNYQTQPDAVNPALGKTPQEQFELAHIQAQAFMSFLSSKNPGGSVQPQQGVAFQPQQGGSWQPQQGVAFQPYQPIVYDVSKETPPQTSSHGQKIDLEKEEETPTPTCNPFGTGRHRHKHGHDHGHSHGGGHDHGHGQCNHDHGQHGHSHNHGTHDPEKGPGAHGKRPNRNEKLKKYGKAFQFFVYFIPFNAWLILMFWIAPTITDDFERTFAQVFTTFCVIMIFITYYYACTTDPFLPKKTVPPFVTPYNQKTCEQCENSWKPERSHHCRTCGRCVSKMDHHCPWIVNCVGHQNHKSFLLFVIYLSLGSLYFLYRTYKFSTYIWNDETSTYGIVFEIYWATVSVIIFPFSLMGTSLAVFHTLFALNNSTTLESMGGRALTAPCLPKNPKRYINPYDKGYVANLVDFLHNRMFLWWWPTVRTVDLDEGKLLESNWFLAHSLFFNDQGTRFDKVPIISSAEMEVRENNFKIAVGGQATEASGNERTINFEAMLKEAEMLTKLKNLKFGDMMLEYGKRKDNFCRFPQTSDINIPEATK